MWLKTRKINALLAPLAPVIEGESSDGRLTGSYRGYAVEAQPHSDYPIAYLASAAAQGSGRQAPVNMLQVTLARVTGSQSWHCQSSASGVLQDLTSRFTSGRLLQGFKPGEFKFERVDLINEAGEQRGERLAKWLGVPMKANADPALQQRLIAAGLFDELDALRWGAHPYLPKVRFIAGGGAAFAGLPDYQSLIAAKMHEIEQKNPGRLQLDVEAGRAVVPSAEQFRDLLEHAVRIAQINAASNA